MGDRLKGKVALITGTGDGIARSTALRFAAEGARIVGCDLNADKAAETLRLVEQMGGEMISVHPVDLSDEATISCLMDSIEERFGGLDILVHYAMVSRYGSPDTVTKAEMNYSLDNVVTMSFLVAQQAAALMRKRGGGSIVLTGSVSGATFGSGFIGNLGHIFPYAVAKGAVIRMGIALANHFGRDRIRVNVVSPGTVFTPAVGALYGDEGTEERRLLIDRQTLLGRISYPDDITNAALFLASDEASNITGVNLYVDGGYVASGSAGSALFDVEELLDRTVERALGSG
ncbi:SDR family NAD(P)-dependent oxidoreductase [Sphingomonas sp. SRS2]|uniref:SDR family NAD(P)-dependent oxidoreductase n=1 Tax=Sphingomonas sp. SRS2 TaxID=133190 RepID=UPI0006979724|nr:SDR family oxidoreductase [Sphingomonas sp. SRS2]